MSDDMGNEWYSGHLRAHPGAHWTLLERGSHGARSADLMLLADDKMILAGRQAMAAEEVWTFGELLSVTITEDGRERYKLEFEAAAGRPAPMVLLGSALAFFVFFGAARRQKLRCKFAFTQRRIRETRAKVSDSSGVPLMRSIVCGLFALALCLPVLFWFQNDPEWAKFFHAHDFLAFLGWLLWGGLGLGVAAGLMLLHDAGDQRVPPFLLYGLEPEDLPELTLDGAPLAARFSPKKPEPGMPASSPAPVQQETQLKNLYEALE
jgi:hypothetical protein